MKAPRGIHHRHEHRFHHPRGTQTVTSLIRTSLLRNQTFSEIYVSAIPRLYQPRFCDVINEEGGGNVGNIEKKEWVNKKRVVLKCGERRGHAS